MDTLGNRIRNIIAHQGTTMTQFAKELNISQSMVSKICADKATPSDRTISDICRIYNINRDWLLYNEGDMVDKKSLEAELMNIFKDSFEDPAVMQKFVSAFVQLPPALWPLVSDYAKKIADEFNSRPESVDAFMEGYEAGVRSAQERQKNDELNDRLKE